MGGGYYSFDVAREARATNSDAFSYEGYAIGGDQTERREVHPILNPYQQKRECMNTTAIVVALDVTRSRGNDSRIMYEKLPTFLGQIEVQGYVQGTAISFCAIGDASSGDQAPLQVGQFEADNRLDQVLSNFWLEEGGGGTGQESYELAAYYYARHSVLDSLNRGQKGYFFFVGDEGFYPKVKKTQVKDVIGVDIPEDIDSSVIFRELQEKYHVFLILPKKSWEERKADIDAEIKQRVEAAGGQYKNVDIRASLIWNNRNDLDVHIIPPSGEEIYYAHKQSACGGWLDVDMNVRGETTKPVENIRWARGKAPKGHYKVFVQNYAFHENKHSPTSFRVEVEVAGEIKHFEGIASPNGETGPSSNQYVYEFDFDPAKPRKNSEGEVLEEDKYARYRDEVIVEQWANVLPRENILLIEDPNTIIDVMLGALSLVAAGNDLDTFIVDMKNRDTANALIEQTGQALEGLAKSRTLAKVETKGILPQKDSGKSEEVVPRDYKFMVDFVVVGLGYGDEGKGTITDFLARSHDTKLVIRYNGGPQAAHNVVNPQGLWHCFSQVGSASLIPSTFTYLSEYMILDLLALENETKALAEKGINDTFQRIYVHPYCPIVTPYHQSLNKIRELRRGTENHGSCGMGVGEIYKDLKEPDRSILRAGDLHEFQNFSEKFHAIRGVKIEMAENLLSESNQAIRVELDAMKKFDVSFLLSKYSNLQRLLQKNILPIQDIPSQNQKLIIYEGAQGILLDEKYGFYPYITPSNTTTGNAEIIHNRFPRNHLKKIGVSRCFATRHGKGPFVTEETQLSQLLQDKYNVYGKWQGEFRFGWLDLISLRYSLECTNGVDEMTFTNLDQFQKLSQFQVCVEYRIETKYCDGGLGKYFKFTKNKKELRIHQILKNGSLSLEERDKLTQILFKVKPVYKGFPAWDFVIQNGSLHPNLKSWIQFMESEQGIKQTVSIISFGQSSQDKIIL